MIGRLLVVLGAWVLLLVVVEVPLVPFVAGAEVASASGAGASYFLPLFLVLTSLHDSSCRSISICSSSEGTPDSQGSAFS